MRLILLLFPLLLAGCAAKSTGPDHHQTDTTSVHGPAKRQGKLLSAFFGLDHALPRGANLRVCLGAGQEDGMPVIFGTELQVDTLQAGDFRVMTRSGKRGKITCVTMAPALDPGELRTSLLVGDFGSVQDPPVSVEVIGNILSQDGTVNFKGARLGVIPLEAGPTLVYAENVPQSQWKSGQKGGTWGHGSGCPTGTRQAVRAVWAGGIKRKDGTEAGNEERLLYKVHFADGHDVIPFALADLYDGDNNHLLCLDWDGIPERVSFPGGHLVDPNHDVNPDTAVAVDRASLPTLTERRPDHPRDSQTAFARAEIPGPLFQ